MKYAPSKPPSECHSLAEIRTQIDQIDRGIIQALGERRRYVMAAGAFKTNPGEVAAPERVRAILEERARWAEEEGLKPELVVRIYSELVAYFIAEEQEHWTRKAEQQTT
jgi:isochorismate pyruvate lyase